MKPFFVKQKRTGGAGSCQACRSPDGAISGSGNPPRRPKRRPRIALRFIRATGPGWGPGGQRLTYPDAARCPWPPRPRSGAFRSTSRPGPWCPGNAAPVRGRGDSAFHRPVVARDHATAAPGLPVTIAPLRARLHPQGARRAQNTSRSGAVRAPSARRRRRTPRSSRPHPLASRSKTPRRPPGSPTTKPAACNRCRASGNGRHPSWR